MNGKQKKESKYSIEELKERKKFMIKFFSWFALFSTIAISISLLIFFL